MVRSILLTLALLVAFLAHAGDATLDRASLKGVKAVGVIIDQLPPDLPKEGVTADALQARFGDVITRISLYLPYDRDPSSWEPVVRRIAQL